MGGDGPPDACLSNSYATRMPFLISARSRTCRGDSRSGIARTHDGGVHVAFVHERTCPSRVEPLGGYFAEHERSLVVEHARRSAELTHAHPEGSAGALAVAVAEQLAWQKRHADALRGRPAMGVVRAKKSPLGRTRGGELVSRPGGSREEARDKRSAASNSWGGDDRPTLPDVLLC